MRRPLFPILLVLLAFACGLIAGAVIQKYDRFAPLLRMAGRHHQPTSEPSRHMRQKPVEVREAIPDVLQGTLSLFILAGQSNMAGYGDLPAEQVLHPKVFVFGNNYRWQIAREPLDDPQGQVDPISIDQEAGFGPGLAFAMSFLEHDPDRVIGLIPCAKGASSIEQWQRHLSENTLYGACLKRVRAATPMGKLAGLLVFQGEQDAVAPDQSHHTRPSPFDYQTKFSKFVKDLRTDLSFSRLPVIFAQLGTHKSPRVFVNWSVVKAQQAMIDLPCTSMITTDDLPLRDGVHFTTRSYQIIGNRFANAMSQLIKRDRNCQS